MLHVYDAAPAASRVICSPSQKSFFDNEMLSDGAGCTVIVETAPIAETHPSAFEPFMVYDVDDGGETTNCPPVTE